MNVISKITRSRANPLILLIAFMALSINPVHLSANTLWSQPLSLFYAKNYMYQGHTVASEDGSYALFWSMMNKDGDRQLCFQRFSSIDQPLMPHPVTIPETQGKVPWRITRAANGNYFILARGNQQSLLLLIDPSGTLLNVSATLPWSISSDSRVELVPDISGGAWLGIQVHYSFHPRRINHYNAAGEPAIPGFFEIPTHNNLYSHMSILVQPDNSVICAYNHRNNARIIGLTSGVEVFRDTTFSFSDYPMVDSRVFQDSSGNLIWVAHMDAFMFYNKIQAIKTSAQGSLLWDQSISFESPSGIVKDWDAIALGDGSYTFAMINQPYSGSPDLTLFTQRFNDGGGLFYGYGNRQRDLEVLDAPDKVQLKLVPGIGGGSWALIRKYDSNDWIYKFGCLRMNPNGIAWSGEQIIHSEPLHPYFGEIDWGGFGQGSNLAVIAHTHSSGQAKIQRSTISTTGTILDETTLAASDTALLEEHTIQPIGNNVFCAWIIHSEPYLWPQKKEIIRYQLVNSRGEKLLPEDGEIISGGNPQDLKDLRSLSLPDGSLLLWWVESQDPSQLRAQLFDSAGSALWEGDGRLIVTGEAFSSRQVLASHYQGDIYFVWDRENPHEIRAQRLVNGIPQWEADGKVLMNAATALYPTPAGVQLNSLDGNTLIYSCGETQYPSMYFYNCLAMWRFDSSGLGLPGFDRGGRLVMIKNQDDSCNDLEYSGYVPRPNGFIVSAYTWDYVYDPSIFDYYFFVTGTIHQSISLEGVCSCGTNGMWSPEQMLILATDAGGYYAYVGGWIIKFDYDHRELFREHIGYFVDTIVETQPGVYIGIAEAVYYFSFTSQGELIWPGDAQYTQNYVPETQVCAQGRDAYFLWKQKTLYYSFFDYNASPLLLQGFTRSSSSSDDQFLPPVTASISLKLSPNPFRDQASLQVSCKQAVYGEISIYNIRGQKLKTLHKGDLQQGSSIIVWDGKDARGEEAASGIYFISFKSAGQKVITKKLMKLN